MEYYAIFNNLTFVAGVKNPKKRVAHKNIENINFYNSLTAINLTKSENYRKSTATKYGKSVALELKNKTKEFVRGNLFQKFNFKIKIIEKITFRNRIN